MSRYTEQRDAIVAILEAVTGIGQVYDSPQNPTNEADFKSRYSSNDKINTAWLQRVDANEDPSERAGYTSEDDIIQQTEQSEFWKITFVYGFKESPPSEYTFQGLVDLIEEEFRFEQITGAYKLYPLLRMESTLGMLANNVLCHKCVWRLRVSNIFTDDVDRDITPATSAPSTHYLLQANINAEEAARISADATLQEEIDGLSTLQLGETETTAYRGDRGKAAYDHSGITSGNPHSVSKSDVGLGNVPDTDTTNPANIVEDSDHRFTTDTEQSTWNGKQDAIAAGFLDVPDMPPAVPNAKDDEFTAGTLDAKWTIVNQATKVITLSKSWLNIDTSIKDEGATCLTQVMPSTPYTMIAKVSVDAQNVNYYAGGLMVGDSSSGKIVAFGVEINNLIEINKWNSYSSWSANYLQVSAINPNTFRYIKVYDNGTNLYFYTSKNGSGWTLLYSISRTDWLTTPDRIGLITWAGTTIVAYNFIFGVDFFRVI